MYKKIANFYLRNFLIVNIAFSLLITGAAAQRVFAAPVCNLSFTAITNKTSAAPGDSLLRTFSVKNTGQATCKNVSFSIFYSPYEQFVSATPAPRASNYYFYVGALKPGMQSQAIVETKLKLSAIGEISTEACASGTGAKDACIQSSVAVISAAPSMPVTEAPLSTTTPSMPLPTPTQSSSKEKGMWIWNFPSEMNSASGQQKLEALAQYGFNEVYTTVDDYLDIAILPEGAKKTSLKNAYFAELALFVAKANSLGMKVDAEGGANNWAFASNRWKGFALIDMVKEYNLTYPNAKLHGFQYDVEPHTLSDYETNKTVRLTEFVAFIDQSVSRLLGTDIEFTAVIPHFFDDAQAWTPAISYNGSKLHTFNHLLNVMEKKKGSKIILMSYRNFFSGSNGTQAISEVEVKKASEGYSTKIVVGQETGNVEPDFVTFHGSTKTHVLDEVKTIDAYFSKYSNYGGVAVHYMDPFLAMPR